MHRTSGASSSGVPPTARRHAPSAFRGLTGRLTAAAAIGVLTAFSVLVPVGSASAGGTIANTGLASGDIQHVWLIILENKSYDETFSGLNDNTYLWQTLPSEGVLLKDYFGTGHSSMDNYISYVSGQAPEEDTQEDCSTVNSPFGSNSTIVTSGSVGGATPNWNFGQVSSSIGPNQALGSNPSNTNGCTYPSEVATLFDQFNLAGVSWKGYAQDLGGAQPIGSTSYVSNSVPNRDNGPCGAPGSSAENPVSNPTYLNGTVGGVSGTDGYPVDTGPSGTATSGTTTSLTDSTQSWTTNQYKGWTVTITGGTGSGEHATVASNTATTLTFSSAVTTAPDSTSTYTLSIQDTSSYTSASLEAGNGTTNDPEFSDQYVAKHFPFPWFESLIGSYDPSTGAQGPALTEPDTAAGGGTNCDANHIANLDDPNYGLVHDLQNNTVPAFSWITPDNCSDGHDTSCKGNNLSGAFGLNSNGTVNLNDPIYDPPGLPAYDPEATTPRNYTGGTYAADLFLAYYVPLIESSAAYAHGLIDITFDEGEPTFTYSGNSFNNPATTGPTGGYNQPSSGTGSVAPSGYGGPANVPTYGSSGTTAPGADSIYGAYGILADAAGENVSGTNVAVEPYGPNSTLATDSNGDQLDPGPGNNAFVDRPPACTSTSPDTPANCVPGIARGGSGSTPGARTDSGASGSSSSNVITDGSIVADDTGRQVTSITVTGTGAIAYGSSPYTSDFPNGIYVGEVTDSGPLFPTSSGGSTVAGSFQLIDDNGNPVDPPGTVTSITLSAECDPATTTGLPLTCSGDETPDPLYDATDPTPGGGDTGAVLISPYITPGTTTSTYYNHYSWLRTMEDLFDVSSCAGTSTDITLPAGTVCGGLDSQGHLGYAAQTGLEDFGTDVFSAPSGNGFQPIGNPGTGTPEAPLALLLPASAGLLLFGGYGIVRRRRRLRLG